MTNYLENSSRDELCRLVARIEKLNEEKAELADDIKAVFAEAKATGFDVKALRAVIALRKQDKHKREEHEALVTLYSEALGDLNGTELGVYAMKTAIDMMDKATKTKSEASV